MDLEETIYQLHYSLPPLPEGALLAEMDVFTRSLKFSSFLARIKDIREDIISNGHDPLASLSSFYEMWDLTDSISKKIHQKDISENKNPIEYISNTKKLIEEEIEKMYASILRIMLNEPLRCASLVIKYDDNYSLQEYSKIQMNYARFIVLTSELYEKRLISVNPIDVILGMGDRFISFLRYYSFDRTIFLDLYDDIFKQYKGIFDFSVQSKNKPLAELIISRTQYAYSKFLVNAIATPDNSELGFHSDLKLARQIIDSKSETLSYMQQQIQLLN